MKWLSREYHRQCVTACSADYEKLLPGIPVVSGLIYYDCSRLLHTAIMEYSFLPIALVTIDPTAEQLAAFAKASVQTAIELCGMKEPK